MIGRPRAVAALFRLLVVVGRIDSFAGGWSVFWNELLDGAPPNSHRAIASAMTWAGAIVTSRGSTARWFDSVVPEGKHALSQVAAPKESPEGPPANGNGALGRDASPTAAGPVFVDTVECRTGEA
jgi:hypothetical protein